MRKIKLGDRVKDKVSGLEGVAFARCTYMTGCDHIGIQPKADNKTGIVPPIKWIDEPMIEILKGGVKLKETVDRKIGGFDANGNWSPGGPAEHPPMKVGPSDEDYE